MISHTSRNQDHPIFIYFTLCDISYARKSDIFVYWFTSLSVISHTFSKLDIFSLWLISLFVISHTPTKQNYILLIIVHSRKHRRTHPTRDIYPITFVSVIPFQIGFKGQRNELVNVNLIGFSFLYFKSFVIEPWSKYR